MAQLEAWEVALADECRVARLGTIAPDGRPHLVPVCYAYIDGHFAIAIDEKPKKAGTLARVRNIERDPHVTLLIDRYEDDWAKLAWVRIEGLATVLDSGKDWPAALGALRSRYPQYESMALEDLPLLRIRPERVVSWRWSA
jgi:PPOX class probable F420-dependent enzyme